MALVERLVGAPLLLLLSYRPGYQPTWMGKSYATQLALQRVTVDERDALCRPCSMLGRAQKIWYRRLWRKAKEIRFFWRS